MMAVLIRELGNETSQAGLEFIITHRVHIMVEGHELVRIKFLVVQLRLEDELVVCRYGGVLFGKEFFIKLLAWAKSRDDYAASSVTVVLDEALGEIVDLHGLSHVEDHDLPSLRHGSRLEDETDGFGDGHEVADDVLMCDCYRDAGMDLVDEQRKHRTTAAEDVAEPDGDDLRPAAREHRGDQLDHPFGSPHDVGRVHCLVGGDDHDLANAAVPCGGEDVVRTGNVRADDLVRLPLAHGHMLVGGGMVDDVRSELPEDPLDLGGVPYVAQDRDDGVVYLLLESSEAQAGIMKTGFVYVYHDKTPYAESDELSAYLAADGAAGARDEDDLVTYHGLDRRLVYLDERTPQKIRVVKVPQVYLPGTLLHLVQRRDDLHVCAVVLGGIDGLVEIVLRQVGYADDDRLDLMLSYLV